MLLGLGKVVPYSKVSMSQKFHCPPPPQWMELRGCSRARQIQETKSLIYSEERLSSPLSLLKLPLGTSPRKVSLLTFFPRNSQPLSRSYSSICSIISELPVAHQCRGGEGVCVSLKLPFLCTLYLFPRSSALLVSCPLSPSQNSLMCPYKNSCSRTRQSGCLLGPVPERSKKRKLQWSIKRADRRRLL